MRAVCVTALDPFRPLEHRTVQAIGRRRRIRALAPKTDKPFIALLNGRAVLRKAWGRKLRDGDTLAFVILPQGGGGGSNPMRMILMLAVAFFAPYAASFMFQGAVLGGTMGSFGLSMATAAVGLAGSMLVNALIPPPKPPSAQIASDIAAASPTYSIGAQGNSARIGQPIPEVFGRHIIYPDFAAMPYTEYSGNDQYLYQLFVIGRGYYDIEQIRIEDTLLSSFDEVETQIVGPGGTVTLFPTRVITSVEVSGQNMEYNVALGPFVANPADTAANRLGFDVVLPRGLYYANDGGGLDARSIGLRLEYQAIDADGAAVGTWTVAENITITAATTTPIRRSYRYTVPTGRYQCRVTRTTTKATDTRTGNDIAWAGLRAYIPGAQTYGDVTLLAMRIRATDNISAQASRKINCIVTRKLPIWMGEEGQWSENLAPNAAFFDYSGSFPAGWWSYNNGAIDVSHGSIGLVGVNGTAAHRVTANASTTMELGIYTRTTIANGGIESWQVGAVHVISFYARASSAGAVGQRMYGLYSNMGFDGATVLQNPPLLLGAWQRYSFSGVPRDNGFTQFGELFISWLTMGTLPSGAAFDICAVQVEKGAVAKPWGAWSGVTATRNPAWAAAYIARQRLPDSRINLAALKTLADTCAARGDRFDGVFDSQGTAWEAITNVGRVARAAPFMQGGRLQVYRDAAEPLPVAMFSPRNMLRNSFRLTYKMASEDMADSIDVEYFDGGTWSWKTVRATLPLGTADKPVKVKLYGVTSRAHAWREGMYMAACNRYRRRFCTWQTEMDGFIPSLGDCVAVTHDMPKWGQFAEAVAWDQDSQLLTVSEPLDWSAGGTHYLAFRDRAGRPVGPFQVTQGPDDRSLYLLTWDALNDPAPDVGYDRERSHVAFGPADSQYIRARVLSVKPRGMSTAEIEAVIESDFVHEADTGAAPGGNAWQLPTRNTYPVVTGLTARSFPGRVAQMVISWNAVAGADYYIVEQSNDGINWTRAGEVTTNSYTATALYGPATLIRVAAVGLTRGPWDEVAYAFGSDYMWINDASLMWSNDANLMWSS